MKTTISSTHKAGDTQDIVAADELARSIAEEFDDGKNIAVYREQCRRFPADVIRRACDEALAVPPEQVKRSRLALFLYLVKKHAGQTN